MKKAIGLIVVLCLLSLSISCSKISPAGEGEVLTEPAPSSSGEEMSTGAALPAEISANPETPPTASVSPVETQTPEPTPDEESNPPESAPAAEETPPANNEYWKRVQWGDIDSFLTKEAMEKCLDYHVFELYPWDWETNILALTFDSERIKHLGSNLTCYHLIDDYYMYFYAEFKEDPESRKIRVEVGPWIYIENETTKEYVNVPTESFPEVNEILSAAVADGA